MVVRTDETIRFQSPPKLSFRHSGDPDRGFLHAIHGNDNRPKALLSEMLDKFKHIAEVLAAVMAPRVPLYVLEYHVARSSFKNTSLLNRIVRA